MLTIIFVTSNKGKVLTMKKWVSSSEIGVRRYTGKIDIPERQLSSVEEIAKYKAFEFSHKLQVPFVVQDSGFYLDAFPGFPGPNIKYVLSTIGVDGILNIVPKENRRCHFEDVLAFWSPKFQKPDEIEIFVGKVHGTVAYSQSEVRRKGAWSDLWKIFIPDGFDTTLAAMDEEAQSKFSETRNDVNMNCFAAFADWIKANMGYLYVPQRLFDELPSESHPEEDNEQLPKYNQPNLFELFK